MSLPSERPPTPAYQRQYPCPLLRHGDLPVDEAGNAVLLALRDNGAVVDQRLQPAGGTLRLCHVKGAGAEDAPQIHLASTASAIEITNPPTHLCIIT